MNNSIIDCVQLLIDVVVATTGTPMTVAALMMTLMTRERIESRLFALM